MINIKAINKDSILKFINRLYLSYIPNKRDNIKQIIIKVLFLVSLITLIISASYIANYFLVADKQDSIIDDSREIWHKYDQMVEEKVEDATLDRNSILLNENSDFKGWIRINNTKVDNPIYQTNNNEFYLNHNQKKQKSVYGALYFDCENIITEEKVDKNLIIYGHEMKNGTMFGSLKKLKSLSFYKENPTIEFSTLYKNSTYKIYSIFVLNAVKEDDDNYIYNIYRQNFLDEDDFNSWTFEAFERSVINTNVDVEYGDNIITLVTCSNDFKNARLIVMAREVREGESAEFDTSSATVNPNPRYPKKWYTARGRKK